MQQIIITRQKTAFTVTDDSGENYIEAGHSYFSKRIALQRARELGGMYHPVSNRTSVKEVVTGYTEDAR